MSPYIWLILGGIFLVIELITLGLTTIWFACGSVVAFFLNIAGLGVVWQVLAFIVVSVVMLLMLRAYAVQKFNMKVQPTNIDSLIGKQGIVVEDIHNLEETGAVKLDGKIWTARTEKADETLKTGEVVSVLRIEGVKLIVKKGEE